MMRIWLFVMFFLSTQLMFSQRTYTVSGVVKDGSNGETIIGATVIIKELDIGVATNDYGFYSLSAPANIYTLRISYVGFEPLELNIDFDQNKTVEIELEQSIAQLEAVVVEGDRDKGLLNVTSGPGVIKLAAEEIKKIPVVFGEADPLKALQLIPGVTKNGELANGINVRGGSIDQNLVLLDEAIIYNTSHLYGLLSIFNPDALKGVTLYKGDMPSKYGGRVSSVLDVRQRDGSNKEIEITGGIGLMASRLSLEGPLGSEKGSFLLAGRSSYLHLLLDLIDDLSDNHLSFYDFNLKFNYTLDENNRLFLSGYFGKDRLDIASEFINNYGNSSAGVRWNHLYNNKLFSNLSLIYSIYNYQVVLNFLELDWQAEVSNVKLRYDLGYYLNSDLKLDFGFSALFNRLNPGTIKPTTENSSFNHSVLDTKRSLELATYISASHNLSDRLNVIYGLRLSYFNRLGGAPITIYANDQPIVYDDLIGSYVDGKKIGEIDYAKNQTVKSYGNLEPRASVTYKLNNRTSITANFSRTAQYIHLLSDTRSINTIDVWTTSGKYTKPQISNQFSAGLKRYFGRSWSIELEGYLKEVDNRIDYINGSNLLANNTVETEILPGTLKAEGVEFLLTKDKGKWQGMIAYTIARARQRTKGGIAGGPGINEGNWYRTPYDRLHDLAFNSNLQLGERWHIGLNFVYQTGRPVTYPNGQFRFLGLNHNHYETRNSSSLPDYHRLDISATFDVDKNKNRKWDAEWVFGIYNLYGQQNVSSLSFNFDDAVGSNRANRISIYPAPIPAITYNFKF